MEAYSSLRAQVESAGAPSLEEVQTPGVVPPRQGDFAAGLRTGSGDAGTRGCFATGAHRCDTGLMTGDFAAGVRSTTHDPLTVGDFAVGQRGERGNRSEEQRLHSLQ